MWCTALFFVFLGFAGNALAQSQQPAAPTRAQQEQPKTTKTDQSRANLPKVTAPQPTIIYIQPPQKTAAEAQEERHERDEKAKLDRRLVDLTGELSDYTGGLYRATVALAVATVFLVVATIGLVVFAKRQSRDMKDSIAATQKAADAAWLSAKAAISTERPFVGLKIIRPGGNAPKNAPYNFSEAFQFQLFNYGRTPATLIELQRDWKEVRNSKDLPQPFDPMVDRGEVFEGEVVITTEEPYSGGIKLRKVFPLVRPEDTTTANCRLWFLGFARYRDVFNNYYLFGFSAYLKPGGDRWVIHGGDKYNYSRQESRPEDAPIS